MNNKFTLIILTAVFCLFFAPSVLANQAPVANAGPDLYVDSGQTIVLQGSGYDPDANSLTYYWNCSGGTLSSYNVAQPTYTAPNINQYNNQAIYTCTLNITDSAGLSNSDSMTVYVNYQQVGGTLLVSKKVINLSSGNLNWQTSVNAKPLDVLSFAITLQANSQDIHNVFVRDILPSNLIYKGNLTINTNSNYAGDITSGVNIGTVYANQPVVVSYQAQAAGFQNFTFGTTTLSNNATITSTEAGTQTASATVMVNNSLVYGATTVSTGLTNNFLTDSFFLPMLLIVLGSWFYFSGRAYMFADWLKARI